MDTTNDMTDRTDRRAQAPTTTPRGIAGVAALEAERQVFRAMKRAALAEQERQAAALTGVPAERVARMIEIVDRVASRPAPPLD